MLISKRLPVKSVYRACGQCIRFNSSVPTVQSSRIYCQNLLQKRDYPSYLQIPFIPDSARDAHLAICALNVEMALIPDQISNQYARGMRMQFWKDAVENCFQGKPKAEPVSILLAHVLQSESVQLTKSFFQTIINERVLPCSFDYGIDTASSRQPFLPHQFQISMLSNRIYQRQLHQSFTCSSNLSVSDLLSSIILHLISVSALE